ncbi:hypothetical protein F5146DRAFT_758207 [Armillaria mellea]|nr:hypothetical protein F5146DRAFT_758207 [Armillaria mellea]
MEDLGLHSILLDSPVRPAPKITLHDLENSLASATAASYWAALYAKAGGLKDGDPYNVENVNNYRAESMTGNATITYPFTATRLNVSYSYPYFYVLDAPPPDKPHSTHPGSPRFNRPPPPRILACRKAHRRRLRHRYHWCLADSMVDAHTSGLAENRFGRRRANCGESSGVWNGLHVDAWT